MLRRLIGVPLSTVTGRANRILGVRPPDVVVATERSPDGRPVPIAWVDDALDLLRRDGEVVVDPEHLGHRSSFIGAVLLTLPGAREVGSPPHITFSPATRLDLHVVEGRSLTFQGDLDRNFHGTGRGERESLRAALFRSATEAACALCGEVYPVRFLWAAHIKKRAACEDAEMRDLENIAMPACLFGCDALYEAGLVTVDPDGSVRTSTNVTPGTPLAGQLARLNGRRVPAHTPETEAYFAWHRLKMFDGG